MAIKNPTGTPNKDKLIGTAAADKFAGLAGADTLNGMAGNDTLDGGTGDDVLDGGTGNDSLIGGDGNDQLLGGTGNDFLSGDKGNDKLDGGAGSDTLKGGIGSDAMTGGDGNDYYIVDNKLDTVIEINKNEKLGGRDTVETTLNYTLGNNVENLILTGITNNTGTGNKLNNVITGNIGNNLLKGDLGNDSILGGDGDDTLDGGLGMDTLVGGAGADTYFMNNTEDKIVENENSTDEDQIIATVSYDLSANPTIEILTLQGKKAVSGIGNDLDNTLQESDSGTVANNFNGAAGDDVINAEGGNDTLEGGEGNDELNGGAGEDVAIYNDTEDNYQITVNADAEGVAQLVIKYVGAGELDEGEDTLSDIEIVQFSDGTQKTVQTFIDSEKSIDKLTVKITTDKTQITEGNTLTFTIAMSSAVAADTTFRYQIKGVNSGVAVEASPADDLGNVTGTVIIPAGQTSGIFTLTPINDFMTEGFEAFNVSLLDASFNSISVSNNVVILDYITVADTTAPDAPVINPVATDGYINRTEQDDGVIVGGTAEANADVTLTFGDAASVIIKADAEGKWTHPLDSADYAAAVYPEGETTGATTLALTVIATDAEGNESDAIKATIIVADTVAPAMPVIIEPTTAKLIKGLVLTGTAEAGATVKLVFGDNEKTGLVKIVLADASGNWSKSISSMELGALTDATAQQVVATATDKAGNESAPVSFTFDSTAPNAPSIYFVTGDDRIDSAERDAGVIITGAAEKGATVNLTLTVNGIETKVEATNTNGDWSYPLTSANYPAKGFGNIDVSVTATDKAGNVSDTTWTPVAVEDTKAPVEPTFDAVATDGIIDKAEKAAGVTLTGITEAGSTVELSFVDGSAADATVDGTTWSYTLTNDDYKSFTGTETTITAIATDAARNTSMSAAKTIIVDTITNNSGNSIVSITGSGTTDAATGNLQFNVTPGDYTYTIANFASGDVLHFPAGNAPQVNNNSYTDHQIDVTYASGSTTTHLVLTGLTGAQEFIGSVNSFNSTFGTGSLIIT